jgi:flagellar hook-length control protein FliK
MQILPGLFAETSAPSYESTTSTSTSARGTFDSLLSAAGRELEARASGEAAAMREDIKATGPIGAVVLAKLNGGMAHGRNTDSTPDSRRGSAESEEAKGELMERIRRMLKGLDQPGDLAELLRDGRGLQLGKEEFSALKDALAEFGLDKDVIRQLEKEFASEGGLNWGEATAMIGDAISAGQVGGMDLGPVEERSLFSLLRKIGFTPEESKELMAQAEQGGARSLLSSIAEKLGSLPADKQLKLDARELGTLAKAAGLDPDQAAGLLGRVSAKQSPAEIAAMVKAMSKAMAENAQADRDSLQSLRAEIRSMLETSLDRSGLVAGRAMSDQQKVIQAEKDELQHGEFVKRGRGAEDKTAKDSVATNARGKGDEGEGGESKGRNDGDRNANFLAQSKAARESERRVDAKVEEMIGEKAEAKSEDIRAENKKGREQWWESFFGKLRKDNAPLRDPLASMNEVRPQNTELRNQPPQWADAARGESRSLSQDVFKQVESGMLRNLGQGRHQITLQLTPEKLGSLNVLLEVQGKDVRAMIRTDSEHAHRLVGEQMAQLKESLEAQGLRVEKLEVETGVSQDLARNWQGSKQHNRQQQIEEQNKLRERMKAMRVGAAKVEPASIQQPNRISANDGSIDLIA